ELDPEALASRPGCEGAPEELRALAHPGQAVAADVAVACGRGAEVFDAEPRACRLVGEAELDSFGVRMLADVRECLLCGPEHRQPCVGVKGAVVARDGHRGGDAGVALELGDERRQAVRTR